MKRIVMLFSLAAMLGAPAWGATQLVVLSVSKMTCAACPITVRKALDKVDGVEKVEISFEKREAIVTYDDAKTTPGALTKATTDAGYPSTVKR